MPPPASPDQVSPQHLMLAPPPPGANPMGGTPLPGANPMGGTPLQPAQQQPPPPENNVITDSLRANMGLPPPPPTPPNQGPFGPSGLIHSRNSDDMQSMERANYGNSRMPVNNNSFGLAT